MTELSRVEKQANDRMVAAIVLGAVLGLIAAIMMWNLASNAFSECNLNSRGFEVECEPNSNAGAIAGIVTFASVMLQAFIIGTILQTNVLARAIARATPELRATAANDVEQPEHARPSNAPIQSQPSKPKTDGSGARLGAVILAIVIVAALLMTFIWISNGTGNGN